MTDSSSARSFKDLGLSPQILQALDAVGYETPSPIQAETIPHLLEGRDVLGQAQTGTGKTAAFALPLLSRLDLNAEGPQIAVLAPTRELAIQVAEAIRKYASHLPGFKVLPIYGGQEYGGQIRALKRGVHVVVGTPGRVMDHMRRGTLKLDQLQALVLDEADEMLRMGFIDDVEWVLERTPPERQVALFSATMPMQIRRIATQHLNDPAQVTIAVKTTTAETIDQRYWAVAGASKLDALTRILEAEPFEAAIIFVRTKAATLELCEKLEARGHAAAALNGDIPQAQRERTIAQLKSGKLDLLIATDVAARGLDVERISHVINYDIPFDTEAYVHRIGRTGRAGRSGHAILFVAARERRMLAAIERATRQRITPMQLPSSEQINEQRKAQFLHRINDTLEAGDLGIFPSLIDQFLEVSNADPRDVAAALARMLHGDAPFLIEPRRKGKREREDREPRREAAPSRKQDRPRKPTRGAQARPDDESAAGEHVHTPPPSKPAAPKAMPMERFRIEVGADHDVKPANIVGAIANEAGIDAQFIGRIDIQPDHSLLDLPEGMPKAIFKDLKKVWVCGRQLKISRLESGAARAAESHRDRGERPQRTTRPARASGGERPSRVEPAKRPASRASAFPSKRGGDEHSSESRPPRKHTGKLKTKGKGKSATKHSKRIGKRRDKS